MQDLSPACLIAARPDDPLCIVAGQAFRFDNGLAFGSRLPRTLVPPAARDYIVVEYEMPNPRSEPHEVAVDREGNGWVTQRTGGRLGKLDRKSLTYVEYEPPAAASTHVRGPTNESTHDQHRPTSSWAEVPSTMACSVIRHYAIRDFDGRLPNLRFAIAEGERRPPDRRARAGSFLISERAPPRNYAGVRCIGRMVDRVCEFASRNWDHAQPDAFEPAIIVRELGPAGHLAPQHDQLMSERSILSLKPAFDLNGEASVAGTKQISDHLANLADSVIR
jgi:hypothetical protein